MITRRDLFVALFAVAVTLGTVAARAQTSVMHSALFNETAMSQEHCFLATELALKAQKQAQRISLRNVEQA